MRYLFMIIAIAGIIPSLQAQAEHRAALRGDNYFDKKDYSRAETAYVQAKNSYNAGNAAFQQGNYTSAATYFATAADKSTDAGQKADAHYNQGNALLAAGEYAAAVKAYETSLRQKPNQPDAQKNLQIAKKLLRENNDPPPQPPPPPPPKKMPPPKKQYLDQANPNARKPVFTGAMTAEEARRQLENTSSEEQKNALEYRELRTSNKASVVKKDW
jgi:Ca-activated chloride channel homolog